MNIAGCRVQTSICTYVHLPTVPIICQISRPLCPALFCSTLASRSWAPTRQLLPTRTGTSTLHCTNPHSFDQRNSTSASPRWPSNVRCGFRCRDLGCCRLLLFCQHLLGEARGAQQQCTSTCCPCRWPQVNQHDTTYQCCIAAEQV